jgi:hypothetical protein
MGRPSKKDAVEKYHCKDGQNLKDLIISLYHGKEMSLADVAEKLYVPANPEKGEEEISLGKTTIFHWMEYFNIPTRDETPAAVSNTIGKTVSKEHKYKNDNMLPANFDPHIDGFVCQMQCPYFEICKYREHYTDQLCPVSHNKRKKVMGPIKALINERYKDNENLLKHYDNIAELAGSTWELLDRKLAYIKSEDVTQVLNRPDPVTGELKEVKVANLLNGEISKDQSTLIRLLELLKLTPKTADEKTEDDIFEKMATEFTKAKKDRKEKQSTIDQEKQIKEGRPEIRTETDFNNVMKELESRRAKEEPTEEEIDNAPSIEEMGDD